MIETFDDFMGRVLQQLYMNRDNHKNSEARDVDFMFQIGAEQYGQLGKALSDGDMDKAEIEVFHTAAILFEIHTRLRGKTNGNRNHDENSNDDPGLHGPDVAPVHKGRPVDG